MRDTQFTDHGTVIYKSLFFIFDKEATVDKYLSELEKELKNPHSNKVILRFYKDSCGFLNLYTIYDRKEYDNYRDGNISYLSLTSNLKNELDNNLDTNFNKKIRELLKLSEIKEKYYDIYKKGSFDTLEEAYFYVNYLEALESTNDLPNSDKIKLSEAREYIKNSDIYKYQESQRIENEIKMFESKKNELEDEKQINIVKKKNLKINVYSVFILGIVFIYMMFVLNIYYNLIVILSGMYITFALVSDFCWTKEIMDIDTEIESYDSRIDNFIEEINKLNEERKLYVTEDKELNKTDNNINENKSVDTFNSEVKNTLLYLIKRTELLDDSDRDIIRSEIKTIFYEYKNNYLKLIENSYEEVSFVSEECLMLKINLFKRLNHINSKIESKIEIKDKINEFDDDFKEIEDSLSNESKSMVLKK